MQTISSQAPGSGAHWHHHVRRHDAVAAQSTGDRNNNPSTRESAPRADRTDAGGSFMRAVFTTLAAFSNRSTNPDADPAQGNTAQQAGASVVKFSEKLKLDIEVQNKGDIALSLQVKAKAKVAGDGAASDDVMQAMQAFAANLFGALRNLFDGLNGQPSAQPAPTSGTGTAPTSAPPTTQTTEPSSASAPAASTSTPAPTQPAAGSTTAGADPAQTSGTNVRWIGSYLSMETRLRILAQHAEKADPKGDASSAAPGSALTTLQQQFGDIAQQLQGKQDTALPSLAGFLHALADKMGSTQPGAFSFAVSVRGSFVSTSA